MAFVESEHKRDQLGRFAKMETSALKERQTIRSVPQPPITVQSHSDKVNLTKQEWALWYKAVGENKALGYWANELSDGNAILKIETETSCKIVITGGTFENPKAIEMYCFEDANEMDDFIGALTNYDEL